MAKTTPKKEKKVIPTVFVKLKDKGTGFTDMSQGKNVSGHRTAKMLRSAKVTAALRAGLLVESTEKAYKESVSELAGVAEKITERRNEKRLQARHRRENAKAESKSSRKESNTSNDTAGAEEAKAAMALQEKEGVLEKITELDADTEFNIEHTIDELNTALSTMTKAEEDAKIEELGKIKKFISHLNELEIEHELTEEDSLVDVEAAYNTAIDVYDKGIEEYNAALEELEKLNAEHGLTTDATLEDIKEAIEAAKKLTDDATNAGAGTVEKKK